MSTDSWRTRISNRCAKAKLNHVEVVFHSYFAVCFDTEKKSSLEDILKYQAGCCNNLGFISTMVQKEQISKLPLTTNH